VIARLLASTAAISALAVAAPANAEELLARGGADNPVIYIGTKSTTDGVDYFKPCKGERFKVLPHDVVKKTTETCEFAANVYVLKDNGSLNVTRLKSLSTTNADATKLLKTVKAVQPQ